MGFTHANARRHRGLVWDRKLKAASAAKASDNKMHSRFGKTAHAGSWGNSKELWSDKKDLKSIISECHELANTLESEGPFPFTYYGSKIPCVLTKSERIKDVVEQICSKFIQACRIDMPEAIRLVGGRASRFNYYGSVNPLHVSVDGGRWNTVDVCFSGRSKGLFCSPLRFYSDGWLVLHVHPKSLEDAWYRKRHGDPFHMSIMYFQNKCAHWVSAI